MSEPDEQQTAPAAPAASPASPLRRTIRRAAPLVLLLTLGGAGWFLYQAAPVDTVVRFEVPPSFRTASGKSLRREAFVRLRVQLITEDDEVLVRSTVGLGAGLVSPLTPPVRLKVPRGRYRVTVALETADGRRVTRVRELVAKDDGERRIPL